MTKAQIEQSRTTLRSLTAQLQAAGVTGLAYPAESIDRLTPSTLASCIQWAEGTLQHVRGE